MWVMQRDPSVFHVRVEVMGGLLRKRVWHCVVSVLKAPFHLLGEQTGGGDDKDGEGDNLAKRLSR